MRQQRAESWRAWLRDRRYMLIFGFFSLCSLSVALWLLLTVRHPGRVDFSRTVFIALALSNLGGTFQIATIATAPAPSRGAAAPISGGMRPLQRVVAWGIVIPLVAEGGQAWFALHNDFDHAVALGLVAIALNFVGQMGAIALRVHQATPPPSPTVRSLGS